MKKRIFGILLMGAMVVASMSMFTSCKDYDDDIQANKDDITALKTQLATLQTAAATAQSAADAAKSAADAAATAAKNAQTAASTAQTSGDDAAKVAAANATAVKAAQDAIKALEGQVAAFAKVEELNAVKADLEKAIADATAGKVSAEELTDALKPISAKIDAIDENLNTLTADVKALKEWKATVEGQIAAVQQDLKNQAEAIKALQEEIKKKIEAGDLAGLTDDTAVKAYIDEKLKAYATSAEVSTAVANALKNYTTTADLKKMLEGYSTPAAVQTAITSTLQDYYTAAKTNELIAGLNTAISNAQTAAASAQTEAQVRAIAQSAADAVSAEVGEKINNLNVLVSKNLTSLVFRPAYMFGGIEADILPALVNARIYSLNAETNTIKHGTNTETWDYDCRTASWANPDNKKGMSVYVDNDIFYHFNPATADLTGYEISFYNNEPRTRSVGVNTNIAPAKNTISNDDKTADGLLKIGIKNSKAAFESLSNLVAANKLPMIALQAAKGDTVVTSDYAEIYPLNYDNLVLADKTLENGLYTCNNYDSRTYRKYHLVTVASTICNDNNTSRMHDIMYNEEINLNDYVETHVTATLNANNTHMEVTPELLEKFGLKYQFYPIDYVKGTESTSQTVHLHIEKDGKAYPVEVDNTGKVIDATKVNDKKGAVGRQPVVRVQLEAADGKIYAYGYLKFNIVEEKTENVVVTTDGITYDAVYANCDTKTKETTWAEIEAKVLNKLNISHETFTSYGWWGNWYVPVNDVNKDGDDGNGYVSVSNNDYYVAQAVRSDTYMKIGNTTALNTAAKMIAKYYELGGTGRVTATAPTLDAAGKVTAKGSISRITDGWGSPVWNFTYSSPNTNILSWRLTLDDDVALSQVPGFVGADGKSTKALTMYAHVNRGNSHAYIPVTIPAGKYIFATAALGEKLGAYWYTPDATVTAQGANGEIRANVPVPDQADPATSTKPTTFVYDILSTFDGNILKLAGSEIKASGKLNAFTNYADNASFVFKSPASAATVKDRNNANVANVWPVKGASGATYYLKVTSNTTIDIVAKVGAGNKIDQITPINVLTLSGSNTKSGITTNNNIVTFAMANEPLDILNYRGHLELKADETFTAYVGVKFVTGTTCYEPIVTGNQNFAIRFLRPVDVARAEGNPVTDALNGGQNINTWEYLKLSEWRGYPFSLTQNQGYFKYYGVSYKMDLANALTDIKNPQATASANPASDSKLKKLSDATNQIELNEYYVSGANTSNVVLTAGSAPGDIVYHAAVANTSIAYLENAPVVNYKNNTSNVQAFYIYIPLQMVYTYGKLNYTQKIYMAVKINPTVGQ